MPFSRASSVKHREDFDPISWADERVDLREAQDLVGLYRGRRLITLRGCVEPVVIGHEVNLVGLRQFQHCLEDGRVLKLLPSLLVRRKFIQHSVQCDACVIPGKRDADQQGLKLGDPRFDC
jgi:hypothetical protein